jgi:hypothetical protein
VRQTCARSAWSERLSLDEGGLPPGSYRLALGRYDPLGAERLVAVGADGRPLPGGRVILDEGVVLP